MLYTTVLPIAALLLPSLVGAFSKTYEGPASNFPAESKWKTLDEIRDVNKDQMLQTGDTEGDVENIYAAVKSCTDGTDVLPNVIMAMIMQESTGNVGIKTEYRWGANGGLLQCNGCPGFPGQHNLDEDKIHSMVCGGVTHFQGNLAQAVDDGQGDIKSAAVIYGALRYYNSGSVNYHNLSDGMGATDSYVSDLANRLLGEAY